MASDVGVLDSRRGGVSLRLFVAMQAALAEGFSLEQVLAHQQLPAEAWETAELEWTEALAGAPIGSELAETYEVELFEARQRHSRRVRPLDEDMAAWFSFLTRWSEVEDKSGLLTSLGMDHFDLVRLHQRWSLVLDDDSEARQRAIEMLGAGGHELPVLEVAAKELPPPVHDGYLAPEPTGDPDEDAGPPPLFSELDES